MYLYAAVMWKETNQHLHIYFSPKAIIAQHYLIHPMQPRDSLGMKISLD